MRALLLGVAMVIVPPPMLSAQSNPAPGSAGGWVPPADHREAVQRAQRDLALLDAVLERRPDDPWYRVQRLRLLYFLGVEREENLVLVDQEAGRLARLAEPPRRELEALAAAYRGAAEVLRARHAVWPGTKTRHLRVGLAELDRLVADHPDDPEIRYLRLVSTAYLPFIFGRRESAREDAATLAGLLLQERTAFPSTTLVAMTGVLLESGRLDEEPRREIRLLRDRAVAETPTDPVLALKVPASPRPSAAGPAGSGVPDEASPSGSW